MEKEIKIDGIEYIQKDLAIAATKPAKTLKGKKYVMVRTYSAGVFVGYLEKRRGKEVTLLNARRIWYWKGAASLSQLATDGTSEPKSCKFPCEVSKVELTETIEILDVTEKARISLSGVPIWQN